MDFEVASFWSGSDLLYFEHLCMKSFVENGYKFHLFTKGPVDNIPDYVEHQDAGEINNGKYFSRYWHFESALNHEYLNPDFDFEASPVRFIHLFGSTKLHLRDAYQGIPPQGSYMQKICDRHNISPETAPIPNYQADPLLTNETKIPA